MARKEICQKATSRGQDHSISVCAWTVSTLTLNGQDRQVQILRVVFLHSTSIASSLQPRLGSTQYLPACVDKEIKIM